MRLLATWDVPIKTVSEGNSREHWHKKALRHTQQKNMINYYWLTMVRFDTLPLHIKMIRIAPRKLDDDNLQFSLKHCRDYLADCLIPGLQMGRADNDTRLSWSYGQEKGKPKEYAVRIEFYQTEE